MKYKVFWLEAGRKRKVFEVVFRSDQDAREYIEEYKRFLFKGTYGILSFECKGEVLERWLYDEAYWYGEFDEDC